jgi:ParB-like chromosome segregation protein Spo0J
MKKKTKSNEAHKKIEFRKLSTLKPHPEQASLFDDLSETELRALAENMERNGLNVPVEILPDGTIIAGHQRVRVAELLGWPEIECWVREDLAEQGETAVICRLMEDNLCRRHLGPLAKARPYARLKAIESGRRRPHDDDLRDILAKQFGLSGRTLDRRARILLNTPSEVQRACEAGTLNLGLAEKVASMSPEDQESIARDIQDGKAPNKVVRAYLKKPGGESQRPSRDVHRLVESLRKNIDAIHEDDKDTDLSCFHRDVETLRHGHKVIDRLIAKIQADHVALTRQRDEIKERLPRPGVSGRRRAKDQ